MLAWKTILVPTDFSHGSRVALAMAADLARTFGATIILHHSSELPRGIEPDHTIYPKGSVEPIAVEAYLRKASIQALEHETQRVSGVTVKVHADLGVASAQILDAVERVKADLVVMGTHGRTGLRHVLLGSVAEKVVRHCKVPVLTVRVSDDAVELATEADDAEIEVSDEAAG